MKKEKNVLNNIEDIKNDFITIASHQLRTPISAVRWSLDTLLAEKIGKLLPKQKEMILEAYENNNFMIKVVNDLLRIARLEEKGLLLQPKFFSLKKIVEELTKKYQLIAKAFNCDIKLKFEKNLPNAYIDPLQIKMVIDSLIDNSIRYSKNKGKGEVKISLKKSRNYLLVKIQDNGIGIPDKEQELIFSKFFRGSNAMKLQTEGLGLSLFLSKKIGELSGGKISFVSKENFGTTFRLYLPLLKKQFEKTYSPKPQKRSDEFEDILKKEREFVSITVHELKAPLGMTKWSLEMLKNRKSGELSEDQKELIDQIHRGNERLLVLVRDLLNLSKLQEGRFEVELKKIDFKSIIHDILTGFLVEAKNKKIKLKFDSAENIFPDVIGDSNRVAQVITNLISNAVKYTQEEGEVLVKLDKKTGKELKKISDHLDTADIIYTGNKKGYIVFSVKDTGIGISDEDKKKMFTRFFRSKKVLKSKTEGTGLGLYITKSIINLHKGDIWFVSEFGKGSTFSFSLPIA